MNTVSVAWNRHNLHQHYLELRDAVYAARDRYNAITPGINVWDALDAYASIETMCDARDAAYLAWFLDARGLAAD